MADTVGGGFPSSGVQFGSTFYDIDSGTTWIFVGGNPRLISNWRLFDGTFTGDPDTSQWGTAQAGVTWLSVSLDSMRMWTGSEAITIRDTSSPYTLPNYRKQVVVQEDFLGGTTSSGNIGSQGFNAFSGTTTVIISEPPNNVGLVRRATGIGAGTIASLGWGATSNLIPGTLDFDILWVARLNSIDADTIFRIGVMNSMTNAQPAHGVYFEKLAADVTWFMVSREANNETRVNTGIPITSGFITFEINKTLTNIQYKLNNVIINNITTDIVMSLINPAAQISNGIVAADKTADYDYVRFSAEGLLFR